MHNYSIIADYDAEMDFLRYVREKKIDGYVHPNTPAGMLFKLDLDEDHATIIKLKFAFKVFGKSVTQPQ